MTTMYIRKAVGVAEEATGRRKHLAVVDMSTAS